MSYQHYEELIWNLNVHGLLNQPPIDPYCWAGAVHSELQIFGMNAPLKTPEGAWTPFMAAAVVVMVKDEGDIIGENLTWLHHIGIRRFIVLNNGSTDDTGEILKRFNTIHKDVELLVLSDPLVRYMQAEKTTGLYRLAISIWPDIRWVIPVDADEFLIAEHGIAVLDKIDSRFDAVSIPKTIHFRNKDLSCNGSSSMQRMNLRSPLFVVPPKIIGRNNLFMAIEQGNHKINLVDNRAPVYIGGFQFGLYYREFPIRSFSHFLRKIANGGKAIKEAEAFLGRKVGGEHWVRFYEQLQSGGEQGLFEIYQRDWTKREGENCILDPFVVDASALEP
ncbi:hypothetical protein AA12717_1559 [Gluconacetobacter sacchari DSM 12717]|uniref:Glycosyltransferase family 2 protein n=2 Tax=Gluconacetobacter sacchari TaxID=92759 RepID=A0A7W4NSK3_9PROT|nr:glycosyltransferase family 2 protein [Gluconacetobacter sacchari]MBB2161280.1 glycosyltransferase family 2 protein [Gluconacetobacter sacchari]GBQ23668.1 hypothetical protein AA12717_1559 [Gluconacetobacter sacchari DSM 12717]